MKKFKVGDKVRRKQEYQNENGWFSGDKELVITKVTYSGSVSFNETDLYKWNSGKSMGLTIDVVEEQIKLAKSYIGKRIRNHAGDDSGLVEGFKVYTNINELWNPTKSLIESFNKTLKTQDVVVALRGKWNSGKSMVKPIGDGIVEHIKEPWEDVKVNGYPAKKSSYGYDFGCANIDNSVLQSARKFLEDNKSNCAKGNRSIQSVKIGEGEFTLDILNKLLGLKPKRDIKDVKIGDWVISLIDSPLREKGERYEVTDLVGGMMYINIPGYGYKTSYIPNYKFELVQ